MSFHLIKLSLKGILLITGLIIFPNCTVFAEASRQVAVNAPNIQADHNFVLLGYQYYIPNVRNIAFKTFPEYTFAPPKRGITIFFISKEPFPDLIQLKEKPVYILNFDDNVGTNLLEEGKQDPTYRYLESQSGNHSSINREMPNYNGAMISLTNDKRMIVEFHAASPVGINNKQLYIKAQISYFSVYPYAETINVNTDFTIEKNLVGKSDRSFVFKLIPRKNTLTEEFYEIDTNVELVDLKVHTRDGINVARNFDQNQLVIRKSDQHLWITISYKRSMIKNINLSQIVSIDSTEEHR